MPRGWGGKGSRSRGPLRLRPFTASLPPAWVPVAARERDRGSGPPPTSSLPSGPSVGRGLEPSRGGRCQQASSSVGRKDGHRTGERARKREEGESNTQRRDRDSKEEGGKRETHRGTDRGVEVEVKKETDRDRDRQRQGVRDESRGERRTSKSKERNRQTEREQRGGSQWGLGGVCVCGVSGQML